MNVVASVRGKKIDIEAETVEEVSKEVEEKCGLDASEQSVLFRGKVLSPTDKLEDIGVAPGDTLNVVKGKRQRSKPISDLDIADIPLDDDVPISQSGGGESPFGAGMGMDQESMKKAMENMSPEDIQKAMKQIDQLLDNNFVEEYFADEGRLEKARIEMLNNLDQYEKSMPGFKAQTEPIVSDPEKWKKAMMEARDQINNLRDQRDLLKSKQSQDGSE